MKPEFDTTDAIMETPEADRLYVVQIFDPKTEVIVTGATSLTRRVVDAVDARAAALGIPYHQGLLHAAAGQVVDRMWGQAPPMGFKVNSVHEISRRELAQLIERTKKLQAERQDAMS